MSSSELSFGKVMAESLRVARSNAGLILATICLITAGFSLIDLLPSEHFSAIPGLIVSVFVQYHVVEALTSELSTGGGPRKRRYGSLFLAGFLGNLGIILGTLLLIVPGILLMARWSISTPYVVVEDMRGSEALRSSWDATSNARWPLFFVFLASIAIVILLFLGIEIGADIFQLASDSVPLSIATNALMSLMQVGSWILGVGIYRCLKPASNALVAVFA